MKSFIAKISKYASALQYSHTPQSILLQYTSSNNAYIKVNIFALKFFQNKGKESFALGQKVILTHDKESENPLQHRDDLELFLYFGFR